MEDSTNVAGEEKAAQAGAVEEAAVSETPKTAPDVADTTGDTAGKPAGAHLDAPAASAQPGEEKAAETPAVDPDDELAVACAAGQPRIALVGKYSDRVPVQLKDKAHLAQLEAAHPGGVEVQS